MAVVLCGSAAGAAPLVSPAFNLDPPIWGPGAAGSQSLPDLATNGSSYLVGLVQQAEGGARSVVATRVDGTGVALDPLGIALGPIATAGAPRPHVASDGTGYLIAWENNAARIGPSGALLDAGGIALPAQADGLVFAGGNYVVHAPGDPLGPLHQLVRVSPAGAVVDDPPLQYGSGLGYLSVAMAASADTLLVLSMDLTGTTTDAVVAQRFDAATVVPIDAQPLLVGGHDHFDFDVQVAAASDGTDFLLVFGGCAYSLPAGSGVLPPACAPSLAAVESVVFDGSGYVASTVNGLQRLALDGSPVGNAVAPGGRLEAGPGGFLAAFTGAVAGASEVRVAPLDAALMTASPGGIAPLPVHADVANVQDQPETVATAGGHVVQWSDARAPAGWYRVRVGPGGVVQDPQASLLAFSKVSLAPSDTEVLALVAGPLGTVEATKLDANGLLTLPATPIGDGDARVHSDWHAVWGGGGYLMSYTMNDPQWTLHPDTIAQRLDSDGQFVDQVGYTTSAFDGEVAFDGTHYVLVYRGENDGLLQGTQVSTAGVVTPNLTIPVAIDAGGNDELRLAAAPGLTLAVFTRSGRIRAARIDAAGGVLDSPPLLVSDVVATQSHPAVAFDGSVFWVVWQDDRDGSQSIVGTRIDPLGNILDGDGLALANGADQERAPSVSSIAGTTLLVYARDDGNPDHRRVEARTITDAGCALDADCPSGFCVDGACCDSACGDGAANDCIACSVAAGAAFDGTCGPVADGTSCAGGACEAGVCEDPGVGGGGGTGGEGGAGATSSSSGGSGGSPVGPASVGAGASGSTPSGTAAGGSGNPPDDDDGCTIGRAPGGVNGEGGWVALVAAGLGLALARRRCRAPSSPRRSYP